MINERPVWATIPTIGHSPHLIPLINKLEADSGVDQILLTVNMEEFVGRIRDVFRFGEPNIQIVETWTEGKSLHHGWNISIEMARTNNAFLAVLNDDILLAENDAISGVAETLSDNPVYAILGLNWMDTPEETRPTAPPIKPVSGTYRNRGVGGFAWVCDPHKITTVPRDFEWWYGDDHVMLSAEKAGHKVGIANHYHVEHMSGSTANSGDHSWIPDAIRRDKEAFRRIWPGK